MYVISEGYTCRREMSKKDFTRGRTITLNDTKDLQLYKTGRF